MVYESEEAHLRRLKSGGSSQPHGSLPTEEKRGGYTRDSMFRGERYPVEQVYPSLFEFVRTHKDALQELLVKVLEVQNIVAKIYNAPESKGATFFDLKKDLSSVLEGNFLESTVTFGNRLKDRNLAAPITNEAAVLTRNMLFSEDVPASCESVSGQALMALPDKIYAYKDRLRELESECASKLADDERKQISSLADTCDALGYRMLDVMGQAETGKFRHATVFERVADGHVHKR